jgi:N-acetylmuramoyl-L-alanine amidase
MVQVSDGIPIGTISAPTNAFTMALSSKCERVRRYPNIDFYVPKWSRERPGCIAAIGASAMTRDAIIDRPSPNHGPRRSGPTDILLLHYTGMPTAAAALARMCDPAAEVSAHYMVDEDGTVCRLVDEGRRAWHAGDSFWAGETDINSRAIGIELVNPGHEFGYRPFPDAQMEALIALAGDIVARHAIPPARVLGHSDVAPARKQDPGELFDWPRLAAAGIGLWPAGPVVDAAASVDAVVRDLAAIGYRITDDRAAVAAFQRHFRPTRFDGRIDAETAGLAAAVAALIA